MPETQGSHGLPGILETIVARKREEVDALVARASDVERAAAETPSARDFEGALRVDGRVALVAECKRRSPGAGEIRPGLDPAGLAAGYGTAGAAALSVLTDGPFFGGSAEDLRAARGAADIPVLRKDFTIHELQVHEARAMGADAILLIVRILDDPTLSRLLERGHALGMSVLVEAHEAAEVDRAVAAGARILGINNRDLSTFTTDLATTERLLHRVPDDVVVVSESGIRSPDDVRRLGEAGVDAVLVGETLLKASDPAAAARSLASARRSPRGRA